MSSDPRVPKSRQPKAYTEPQLEFLKSFLPEYERRSQGSIRGDSKKFAFQKATEYIAQFGLSPEFMTVEDGQLRFKEQIYNWFKNTVGRNRRKAEGRTRGTSKKANGGDEKGPADTNSNGAAGSGLSSGMPWNGAPSTAGLTPYAPTQQHGGDRSGDGKQQHAGASSSASPVIAANPGQVIGPMQYSPMHTLGSPMPSTHPPTNNGSCTPNNNNNNAHTHNNPHTHPSLTQLAAVSMAVNAGHVMISPNMLREAFLTLDSSSIASMVQNFVSTHPSPTPLTPVVEVLFEASIAEGPAYNTDPQPFVRRYAEMSAYLPPSIVHAGFVGPLAAFRALQMQIRRNSIWTPTAVVASTGHGSRSSYLQPGSAVSPASVTTSLSEDMQRIANERQRRKDHIQWARIHAAALELGMMDLARGSEPAHHHGFGYTAARAFSEMVARDAVWEADEAEWVAGSFVLRAVIRTGMQGDRRQREEYAEILRSYEGRWKEIKDEVRQTMATEVLLSAKEELSKLEESMS